MNVNTKAFGTIDVNEKLKVKFPQGLFGFEEFNEYVLLDDEEHKPFFWLQSIDEKEIAFILIDPFLFRKDYEANITDEELADIGITSADDILIYVIVTIPPDGNPMTANLQGPVVINNKTMTAKQSILSDSKWKTRHDILAELNGKG